MGEPGVYAVERAAADGGEAMMQRARVVAGRFQQDIGDAHAGCLARGVGQRGQVRRTHYERYAEAGGQGGVGFRIRTGRRNQQGTVLFDSLRNGRRAGERGGENSDRESTFCGGDGGGADAVNRRTGSFHYGDAIHLKRFASPFDADTAPLVQSRVALGRREPCWKPAPRCWCCAIPKRWRESAPNWIPGLEAPHAIDRE